MTRNHPPQNKPSRLLRTAALLPVLLALLAATPRAAAQSSDKPTVGPVRWDNFKPGQPPQLQLYGGEFPAGMFRRPSDLNLENWFHDGHMRVYALLNLGDVVRSVDLQRGKGPVYMFGNARVPQLLDTITIAFNEDGFPKAGTPISVRELFSWMNGQGILVIRHGKVVFEEYPGMDPSQRHHWMSVSKSTLNMLLGRLMAQGKIDFRRRVDEYVPELKGKGYGSFPVQEVADMDADVNMNEKDYHDPKSAFWDFGRSMGWFNDNGQFPGGVKQFLTTLNRLEKPKGEAGERVRYTSSSSMVIGWIIEKITQEPLADYVEQNLWRHVGAVANASVTVDKHGFPFVGGGYSSTLRDLARYGTIWANQGVAPDGTRVFEESWMKENMSGKGPTMRGAYHYHNQSYSNGSAIVHQGHSGQMQWVNPSSGTIVVCFSSMTTPGGGFRWSGLAPLSIAEAIDKHLRDNKIAEKAN